MDLSKLKLELDILVKKINFIHVIAIFLIIIWIVSYNLQSKEIKITDENNANLTINKSTTSTPKESLDLLPIYIERDDTAEFTYLFSKFDLSIMKWEKIKTVFRDWIKKYLIIYEIEWWLERYLNIRDAISNFIVESWDEKSWIFEANNLWVFSFYYNDFERKNTVYLVALIWWKVWAFEYPRDKHEEIKIFTKSIAESY